MEDVKRKSEIAVRSELPRGGAISLAGPCAAEEAHDLDEVTRAFFELKFELAYLKLKGDEFQDFFATIMEKRYSGDFIKCRPWGKVGDRKNDGYLKSQRTLFQVYAPNEMEAAKAVAKIDEDYNGALSYWEDHFDRWVFVHNSKSGLGPDVIAKLLEVETADPKEPVDGVDLLFEPDKTRPSTGHWGFEELRRLVFELGEADLASLFGPAPSRKDMLDLGMKELAPVLDHLATQVPSSDPDLRPPPADKIERNMLSQHVTTLLTAGMMRVALVKKYFGVQPTRQDEIAESLRLRYESARNDGHSPDEVFAELQRHAGGNAVPSAPRQSGVLAVLAFFFEECDIFERDGDDGGAAA